MEGKNVSTQDTTVDHLDTLLLPDAETILEYLYNRVEYWQKTPDPLDTMKQDLRSIITTYKTHKFNRLHQLFWLTH